jgi:serine/threonine protein kinase
LEPGIVLAGKYLIGKGIGHGGFGVTYLAFDQVLGLKLAIKEYLPQDCASRPMGQAQVVPFTGEGEKRFRQGLESFLQEARILARFDGQAGIVGVRDFFTENGTAYLVMNYLEGITLKDVLVKPGGPPMPFEKLMKIMLPVMGALEKVHDAGLLHRDVSPDNIFLTTQGQVVLIDFGAARQSMSAQRSMSVILKPGYAPEEQYKTHGNQGPWSDVYALSATMYRALTGKVPPEALDRLTEEKLIPPSKMGIQMPPRAERALLRAMAVRPEERFQSVKEFRRALTAPSEPAPAPQRQRPAAQEPKTKPNGGRRGGQPAAQEPRSYPLKAKKRKGKGIWLALLLLALLAALAVFLVMLVQSAIENGGFLNLDLGGRPSPTKTAATATPLPSSTASATATPEATPSPSPEPTPSPTPYEGDPAFEPGRTPSLGAAAFVPGSYRLITETEEGGQEILWFTGKMPQSHPEVLCARFRFDAESNSPIGGVYLYRLSSAGDLLYGPAEGAQNVLLPAQAAVGTTFDGVYGHCEVLAVDYSGRVDDVLVSDAVVLRGAQGYIFLEPGVGVALTSSGLEEGLKGYVNGEQSAEEAQFHQFIDP